MAHLEIDRGERSDNIYTGIEPLPLDTAAEY